MSRTVTRRHAVTQHGWGTAAPPGGRGQDLPPQPPQRFSSAVSSTRRASPQPTATTSLPRRLRGPPALSSTPPAVQSAPRVGTVVRSWSTARGTGAAQTVWNEATSPSPMDQDPPAMLGKRTTQALVAQGIEHRFPKRALAVPSPPPCTADFPSSAWELAVRMAIFGVPLSPAKSSHLQPSADHTRTSSAQADGLAASNRTSWRTFCGPLPTDVMKRPSQS